LIVDFIELNFKDLTRFIADNKMTERRLVFRVFRVSIKVRVSRRTNKREREGKQRE
jgi:hypothetical protein